MKKRQILFTKKNTSEMFEFDIEAPKGNDVLVKTEFSVVSGGTERACITDAPNVYGTFPRALGYCGIGKVAACGDDVKNLSVGDRVLIYHGTHSSYVTLPREKLYKVEDDSIPSLEASFSVIASMGLGGVRKLELELGESASVIGLGLLGMFSVQFERLSGANPVIAVDFSESRRALALKLGADFAFSPDDTDFAAKVKKATNGKGVNGCVEVTGNAAALNGALSCASYMGRVSLLGCTRVSNSDIDYYNSVHKPGVKLIGAHNFIRPKHDSYPHHWTMEDDCRAILSLIARGRLDVSSMISRVVNPEEHGKIYDELINNKDFPLGTVFDWRNYD